MRIIGLTGPAGSGKDLAASMIHGALRVGFSDPIYRGLEAMLGVSESRLRNRRLKETPIEAVGRSPRRMLQTLGTDWGRDLVSPDVWVRLAVATWRRAHDDGYDVVVAPDVRFANEVDLIREWGGEVWLVHRPDVTPVEGHPSERGLPLSMIDRLLVNAGTPDDLRARVAATLALTPAAR